MHSKTTFIASWQTHTHTRIYTECPFSFIIYSFTRIFLECKFPFQQFCSGSSFSIRLMVRDCFQLKLLIHSIISIVEFFGVGLSCCNHLNSMNIVYQFSTYNRIKCAISNHYCHHLMQLNSEISRKRNICTFANHAETVTAYPNTPIPNESFNNKQKQKTHVYTEEERKRGDDWKKRARAKQQRRAEKKRKTVPNSTRSRLFLRTIYAHLS